MQQEVQDIYDAIDKVYTPFGGLLVPSDEAVRVIENLFKYVSNAATEQVEWATMSLLFYINQCMWEISYIIIRETNKQEGA